MNAELRVDGSATVYRLHDIGYAVALDHAADLLGPSTRGRVRPSRLEARAIQIRNPPLFVALGSFEVKVAGRVCPATLSAHLFDFGVCSLRLAVAAGPGLSWPAFAEFASALDTSPDPGTIFDRELPAFLERVASSVERLAVAPLSEEYKVYRVDRLERTDGASPPTAVAELLTEERLVALLFGEQKRLSSATRHELVPHRFSYYDDDLTVLTWESALVVEPRADDRDIEYVLEFANAQLLELRIYDLQLDAELPDLYDRAAAVRSRRRLRLSGRFRSVLSDLHTRVADLTETVERVEHAL